MTDLTFIETQILVDELASRFDHIIVAGYKITGKPENEHYTYYQGSAVTCQGLASDLDIYIYNDGGECDCDEETTEGV